MKRLILFILYGLISLTAVRGQNARIDSLRKILARPQSDTGRVLTLTRLTYQYNNYTSDSSLKLARQARQLAHKIRFVKGESLALEAVSNSLLMNGDFPAALDHALKALALAQTLHQPSDEASLLDAIGNVYFHLGENRKALHYFQQARKLYESVWANEGILRVLNNMVRSHINLNQLDSARIINQQAWQLCKQAALNGYYKRFLLINSGRLATLSGSTAMALHFYREALRLDLLENKRVSNTQLYMAELFQQNRQLDSSLHYAQIALANSRRLNYKVNVLKSSSLLANVYKSLRFPDSALHYMEIARVVNDSLYGAHKFQQLQLLVLAEQQRQQNQQAAAEVYKSNVRFFSVLVGLGIVLLVVFFLYRNNQQKRKANQLLNEQKSKVEEALYTLRTTQTQLIQREKMASLGELTAGIAHEIQNPLNFVNNFAEVSVELAQELEQSVLTNDTANALELSADLRANMNHITQNGQRASNIVKGMLEHSRTSTGERQPTDLNALADEYLRLAYQGARAKDSTFKCELITDFAADLPPVEVVPQDIGRVLMNLYNNAFYAVQKQASGVQELIDGVTDEEAYQPKVWVSTEQVNEQIKLRIKDNGTGIPQSIQAKIFQPFFTTKPTGQGTGLGLSLSYDIVTKGHGGEIRVESEEGEGSDFSINLPLLN